MEKEGMVKWGNCLADPEGSDEAFHVDDAACDYWKNVNDEG